MHKRIDHLPLKERTVLYEFITSNKGALLARARTMVESRPWPTVSKDELENGLPLFLTQLAETLRLQFTPEPFSPTAIATSAGEHGKDLMAKGFTVAQVVHDYGDICQAITETAVERNVAIASQEFQILNFCLDNAIASAVTEFSRQREQSFGEGEAERLGYLTHELRNLLSTVMLSYGVVKSGRVAPSGSTGALVDRSLMRMRDLLDATISEVRLSAGRQEMKSISVAAFLHDSEQPASLQAAQQAMNLTFVFPPDDAALINADSQLLSSALFNLIQNALKYSVPHGHVTVRAVCENERVSIEVEDECGGLPDKNAEAYFSTFGARRGKNRSGLGLGLSVSRKAMRSMGGDIRTRNLPGKGCVFAIELPLATLAAGVDVATTLSPAPPAPPGDPEAAPRQRD